MIVWQSNAWGLHRGAGMICTFLAAGSWIAGCVGVEHQVSGPSAAKAAAPQAPASARRLDPLQAGSPATVPGASAGALGPLAHGRAGVAEIPDANRPEATSTSGPELLTVPPPFHGLSTNDFIIRHIKKSEGLRLKAYRGPGGKALIGYGHAKTAKAGMTISVARANALLRRDLKAIEGTIKASVTVPINQNELSAMVDLAYNIGTGAFRRSSVLRLLNRGARKRAARAFLLWNKIRRRGKPAVNRRMSERRDLERRLFLSPTPNVPLAESGA